jgi:hypothetical protein
MVVFVISRQLGARNNQRVAPFVGSFRKFGAWHNNLFNLLGIVVTKKTRIFHRERVEDGTISEFA